MNPLAVRRTLSITPPQRNVPSRVHFIDRFRFICSETKMDCKNIAFCPRVAIVCCLTLIGMGLIFYAISSNVQAKLKGERGEEIRQLQLRISKLNESMEVSRNKNLEFESKNSKLEEKISETKKNLKESVTVRNDCKELLDAGHTADGVYTINIGWSRYPVACDMTNGGWTIIQRRFNGSINFRRDFQTYTNGFGLLNSEFWMGLEKIYQMTSSGRWMLRVDLTSFDGDITYVQYKDFKVRSGPGYELSIGNYSGTAGDSLAHSNGARWSTYDRDQDGGRKHCASDDVFNGAGWWKADCGRTNVNAYSYKNDKPLKGIFWKRTRMNTTMMKMIQIT